MIKYLDLALLKPHECVIPENVYRLQSEITTSREWTDPIVIDRDNYIIMDGHHRYHVARALGLKLVPCFLASYQDDDLRVSDWKTGGPFDIDQIIEAALSGVMLPPKTTRHVSEKWGLKTRLELRSLM